MRQSSPCEGSPEHPLRSAGLIEVLGDPAEPERPAGAEQERGVDVRGLCDDAFLEQVADLVGDGVEGLVEDLLLLRGSLSVTAISSLPSA